MADIYFSAPDYVVMGLLLFFSASIGIFYAIKSRRNQSTEEYLMAGRKMHPIPVALSLISTFMSAVTLIGTPSEIYYNGTQFSLMIFSFITVVAAASYIYIPVFYNISATSSFEYLGLRFGNRIRLFGSFIVTLQMIMYMALVLYAPSLALNAVTGFSIPLSVVLIGLVCTFYTTIGGMKAVMWTDALQIVLMFASIIILVAEGFSIVGREVVIERGFTDQRIEFSNFNVDPLERHTFWTLIFGGFFTWLSVYGINQSQVQRCLSVSTLRKAQIALWINAFGLVALYCILTLLGLVIYAYYPCHPNIKQPDQLTPLFVMDVLGKYPGLPGFFVAGLFSGTLSTISSGVNSLAATVLVDFIKPCKSLTESQATMVSKILALAFGLLCIGLAFAAGELGQILQAAFSIYGMIGGPLLGVYTLGMMFPWINNKGASIGLITGLIIILWIGIGAQIYKPSGGLPRNKTSCVNYTQINDTDTQFNVTYDEINMYFNLNDDVSDSSYLSFQSPSMENKTTPSSNPSSLAIYRLSYLWYSGFSSLIVVIVAHIVTFCTGRIKGCDLDPRLIFPLFYKLGFFLPKEMRHKLLYGIQYNGEFGVIVIQKRVKSGTSNLGFTADNSIYAYKNNMTPIDNRKKMPEPLVTDSSPPDEITSL